MKTDKGLKEAVRRQPEFRLPSNFGYRMMQQINQEAYRMEKRRELRSYLLLGILSTLMAGGCFTFIGWWYWERISTFLNTLSLTIPPISDIVFYLPMLLALPLLYWFDKWLRRILS